MGKTALTLPIIAVALIGIISSVFIVDERETALVLQFGRIVSVKTEPGLAFKIPLVRCNWNFVSYNIYPCKGSSKTLET